MIRPRIVVPAVIVFIAVIWWLVFGLWQDILWLQWKWLTRIFLGRFLFPGGWNLLKMSPWAMLFISIGLATVGYLRYRSYKANRQEISTHETRLSYAYSEDEKLRLANSKPEELKSTHRNWFVGAVVFAVLFTTFGWMGTNDKADSYSSSATFVVADPEEVPSSLNRLVEGAGSSDDCDLVPDHGMTTCVKQGEFDGRWYTRGSSAAGAKIVLKRTSGTVANTELMGNTLSYVYDDKGEGVWTAIRNGKSKTPIYGVVSWSGSGNPEQCLFKGDYALNQAFGGNWGSNLTDTIAKKFPDLFYEESDMWGYCDGDEPIVVIPVAFQENFAHRVTFRSAGVLVIKGSSSGVPMFQHDTDVKAGDFGGPVYPASLVDQQRDGLNMTAGRINKWFRKFGFDTLDVKTQEGNASNYLLRSKADDRTYWVTPMRSRKSDSELVTAYSVTPADEAGSGKLNEQKVYVLSDDDPRIVNLEDLEARTREALIAANPGFFSGDGKLVEFLPADEGNWQVYAELGGRVVYRITVPTDSRIRPQVAAIDPSIKSPEVGRQPSTTPGSATDCGSPTSELSDKALATCLANLARELESRQKE